jgi:hypothetical protein
MATTEPVTPPRPQPSEGGGPILGTLLPLVGFVVLALALLVGLVLAAVLFYRPAWLGVPADQEPILRRTLEPMGHVAGVEIPGVFWWLILLPVLAVGFTYVIVLYVRDGRAVGAPWALFLALARCTVYLVLAGAFLLPGVQRWEESHSQSRVVLGFDASQSVVQTRDGLPTDETPLEKLPTRQDQVLQLLTDPRVKFLDRLEQRNPVYAYRFGRMSDDAFHVFADGGHWSRREWEERSRAKPEEAAEAKPWPADAWREWLTPDPKAPIADDLPDEEKEALRQKQEALQRLFTGTNVGDSVLSILNREANNMLQGVVVFSDGRSTEGAAQTYRELADRAQKAKVPIFVVAVGEDRPQVRIEITDLRVPEQARPDDKFKVIAEVTGEGLADQDCDVSLDVLRPDKTKAGTLKPKAPVKFKPGEPPHAQAEFEVEASLFPLAATGSKDKDAPKRPELEEGEWAFVARVPKSKREAFAKVEHVTDPARVLVVKRPLRILLFAGGPMRDYQFLRNLLMREVDKHRVELSIYLQPAPGQDTRRPGIVQDVPPERLLSDFPLRLQDESADKPDERLYNLAAYDLIIAFDPDWTRLRAEQLALLERWVGTHGGGLVVVGGPVYTNEMVRPGQRDKLKPVLDLYPVVLQDSRIQEIERGATEPWRLNFPGATNEMEFLRLDEDPNKDLLAGWEEFFSGTTKGVAGGKTLVHGFYNYYPVERAKEGATVVATFTDPRARLADGKEQPYIVTMPYGSGKVVWLGAGEFWRLREAHESFLERFWTKLCRYAGSGNATRLTRRISLVMGKTFTANHYVNVDAQIFGRDLLPLPENTKDRPTLVVRPPAGTGERERTVELGPRPSQGEWNGWFTARFLVRTAGEYNLDLKVPDTGDSVSNKFVVKESNPELDNTRPDFDALYWLASEATDVINRVDEQTQKQLKAALSANRPRLQQTEQPGRSESDTGRDVPRLYFTLQNAELIPSCMVTARKDVRSRGAVEDVWDKGRTVDLGLVNLVLLVANVLLVLATLVVAALTVVALTRGRGADMATYLLFTLVLLVALVPLQIILRYLNQPVLFSVVLIVVVGLLAVEWLSRKLLRLA